MTPRRPTAASERSRQLERCFFLSLLQAVEAEFGPRHGCDAVVAPAVSSPVRPSTEEARCKEMNE